MLKIIPIQEAYKNKIERQLGLPDLRYKSHGSCAYIGDDISPGCYPCFHSDAFSCNFTLGRDTGLPDICNRDCVYCFEPHQVGGAVSVPDDWRVAESWKENMKRRLLAEKHKITSACKMQYYEFTGAGEPLLYLPMIAELIGFLRAEVDAFMGTRGWAKIYTNGTLLTLDNILVLKDLGFDEVRVHPGATDFLKEVYDNIALAVRHIPTVTVETPAWPPHRARLFEMLPILEDIGVKHLDICQIEITSQRQLERMERELGYLSVYQAFYPVMDDGGLVEDIMREVRKRGYAFSVLDCNGFAKQNRSALTGGSFWTLLNRRYPPEWESHRLCRKL